MDKLKLYIVTKSNSNRSIIKGDLIWLSKNNELNIYNKDLWFPNEKWNVSGINDFRIKPCTTHCLYLWDGNETVRRKLSK